MEKKNVGPIRYRVVSTLIRVHKGGAIFQPVSYGKCSQAVLVGFFILLLREMWMN